jgi:hypothetical protein
MISRVFACLLTALVAAVPLAARADLYINAGSGLHLQSYEGCDTYGTGVRCYTTKSWRTVVFLHPIGSRGATTYDARCVVRYMGARRWEAETSNSVSGASKKTCTQHWNNENTLVISVK